MSESPFATIQAVGSEVRREDGAPKVSGRTRYAGDVSVPGLLHARPILSPHPHARIVIIDSTVARQLPGVVAVFTAADLPLKPPATPGRMRQPLANDEVLFDGHPVAMVVATSDEIAEDAAALVTVIYEELPAALDLEDNLFDPRPLVRRPTSHIGNDAATHTQVGSSTEAIEIPANAADAVRYRRGDVMAGFHEADAVVERVYRTSWVHQSHLEPQSCLAVPDGAGRLTLHTSTQGAFASRTEVAAALGIAQQRVTIVPMEVGGGFGAKYALLDPLVAGMAWALQRPVRLVYSRSDEFRAANPAHAMILRVKTGARRDGTLTALEATVIADTGAFASPVVAGACALLGGIYRFPALHIDGYEVYTHRVSAGAYRAPGMPQACFAIEGQMDELARQLGLDPLDFRLRNAAVEGDPFPAGDLWPCIGSREVLAALRAQPAWRDRHSCGPHEGVGIAFAVSMGASCPANAACRLDADGILTVIVGSVDISGSKTGLALLAADAFGISPANVAVIAATTDTAPYAGPTGGSHITYTVGAAVANAAAEARRQVLDIAAAHLEVDSADLHLTAGRVEVRGVPGRGLSLGEIYDMTTSFGGRYEPVYGRGASSISVSAPAFVAHLARVRVDPQTGEVTVLDYVAVQDVGRAINPLGIADQIRGGVAQGLGWALFEQLAYDDDGHLITGSLMDYALPQIRHIPPITPVLVEVASPEGPLGVRGVGEPPVVAGAAAVANAIASTIGIRPTELPMTAERVWQAIQSQTGPT